MSLLARERKRSQNPDPIKGERVGHPEKPNQFLGVDVLEWYHPAVRVHLQKKSGRMGHPPDFDIIVVLLYIVEVRFWGA
jgi:hypothetical protein